MVKMNNKIIALCDNNERRNENKHIGLSENKILLDIDIESRDNFSIAKIVIVLKLRKY